MNALPFSIEADGLRLAVRLTPRAGKSAIMGVLEDAGGRPVLTIRVAAPPVEGAANRALIVFLASALGLPKSAMSIQSGETSRVKMLFLSGDGEAIAARLTGLIPVP